MATNRTALVERLQQRLLSDAGTAGWAYYTGKSSRVEPTAWALLALGSAWTDGRVAWADFVRPHIASLISRQADDGLLAETEAPLVNLAANGVAALGMTHFASIVPGAALEKLYGGLIGVKGVRFEVADPAQDSRLQGWPWVRDTFSWVEPTAWCLLALKRSSLGKRDPTTAARVEEAEKLLVNRTCASGGWNFGNASVLGQDLRAYVPTTAMALLAMQDRRNEPAVDKSVQFLIQQRLSEHSAMALSLTAICLHVYGLPVDDVEEQLSELIQRSEHAGSLLAIAMAAYALSGSQHNFEAFRVRA